MKEKRVASISNRKGFTLIEVLITLAILGVVVIPLSGFFVRAGILNSEAKEKLVAMQIAQRYLERYKANSSKFVNSAVLTDEFNEKEGKDYHISVVVEPFETKPGITPAFDYKYSVGDASLPNEDIRIEMNDSTSTENKNTISITKKGETAPFFMMDTSGGDVVLDVRINKAKTEITFSGWRKEKNGDAVTAKTVNYDLKQSFLDPAKLSEYIYIVMNSDQNLTINAYNEKSMTLDTECYFYDFHEKGKNGKVFGFSKLGKNDFIENLYDETVTEGLPAHGLYKIVVRVYRGNSSSGEKIYELDSLIK